MQTASQLITLRDGSGAKALVAPELGGWLLRYTRHLPEFGYVDGLHYADEIVARYPHQMYAGNPLLFPQVSFNHLPGREHHYEWQGARYAMPQHGFARRSKWKVIRVNETGVTMELDDRAETRAVYPFPFRFEVHYELLNGRLQFRQQVENRGDRVMPFSTGIHPYLPAPVTRRGQRKDCYLELPSARKVVPHENWQSWTATPFAAQRLPASEDVSGTLFLTDLAAPEISLVDRASGVKITLNFGEAPAHRFVALWSKTTSEPFYCIEPWTALPNSFSRKESELILLPPGERFQAEMWLDISAAP